MKKSTELRNELYKETSDITIEQLPQFIKKAVRYCRDMDMEEGYSMCVYAVGAAAVAAAEVASKELGITGFQASCINFEFLSHWFYTDNKCGLKLINYDDMLYPQNAQRFEKSISEDTFSALRKEAQTLLDSKDMLAASVAAHLKSIVEGEVPFGYEVYKEGSNGKGQIYSVNRKRPRC